MKSQAVRLVDIFALGPFMVWYGLKSTGMSALARGILAVSGAATIAYNWRNYARAKRGTRRRRLFLNMRRR